MPAQSQRPNAAHASRRAPTGLVRRNLEGRDTRRFTMPAAPDTQRRVHAAVLPRVGKALVSSSVLDDGVGGKISGQHVTDVAGRIQLGRGLEPLRRKVSQIP